MRARVEPVLLDMNGEAEAVTPLPRVHEVFNEQFLQELLASHPDLLPVESLREDVGQLLCIGREVSIRGSGTIDNLFLSTGGYVIVNETKLWHNPQARREVVSQVVDYVKDIVTRDFDWLDSVWRNHFQQQDNPSSRLIEALGELDEELDEQVYFDRDDVFALLVGDGIETRLQELVDHLGRDSAHFSYSLGVFALHCYRLDRDGYLLALPELIQHVVAIERAHVRVDVAESLKGNVTVSYAIERETGPQRSSNRRTLRIEAFYDSLAKHIGNDEAERVRSFIDASVSEGLIAKATATGIRFRLPDPLEQGGEMGVFAISHDGMVYNPQGLRIQLVNSWDWPEQTAGNSATFYWRLNQIDRRFPLDRIVPSQKARLVPIAERFDRLGDLCAAATD